MGMVERGTEVLQVWERGLLRPTAGLSASRLMSPRAYRAREAKVSLLQRCRSGGRRRLTVPMLCADAPTIGLGWRLYGMVFTAVGGLQTHAYDPCLLLETTAGKELTLVLGTFSGSSGRPPA
eukprot:5610424-Prymnesium_polylepis.1